jgi:hypothetical protein
MERDPPLIPMCEVHRARRRSKGWDKFLWDAALTRDDLVDAADLLRGRWNRWGVAGFDHLNVAL